MTGYEAYEIFNGIKLHFTSKSYDYLKYSGKSKTSIDAFDRRKDKYYFHRISRKFEREEYTSFLVYNFAEKNKIWIGDLLDTQAEDVYNKHLKIIQSMTYVFENECRELFEDVENPNSLLLTSGDYPVLLTKYLRGEVSLETLCILNYILNFMPMWENKITDTIRWPEINLKLKKFSCFFTVDVVKYRNILKKIINHEN